MAVRVTAGARLHFGFGNLSLAHERLYGSLGVALDEPSVVVEARAADELRCDHARGREFAATALELLDEDGAAVDVVETLPRHAGLGSGTQLALAVLTAVAAVNDRAANVRERAPQLGRGGRSGVGVAAFERGGFVLDAGHPTERFTTEAPPRGEWTVPPVAARHELPERWRFVLLIPDADPGRSGPTEDRSMRAAVEAADPALADEVAGTVLRRALPAAAEGDVETFGDAVAEIGRLNGAWYADEQGGVYRPPAGELVAQLRGTPSVYGVGQSSWGPVVYGVTTADRADDARADARDAFDAAGVDGDVLVVGPRATGATVDRGVRKT